MTATHKHHQNFAQAHELPARVVAALENWIGENE
jgi:hypothetical protein